MLHTLNLDRNTAPTVPYRSPTPEEQEELNRASYIVTEIGKTFVQAYGNEWDRVVAYALGASMTRMLEDGLEVHIDGLGSGKRLEFRIADDRLSTIVRRFYGTEAEPELEIDEPSEVDPQQEGPFC